MARVISNVDRVALCGNAKLVVANDLGAPCGSALVVDQSEKIFSRDTAGAWARDEQGARGDNDKRFRESAHHLFLPSLLRVESLARAAPPI